MTAGLPIRPAPAAFRISTASPILLHPSLFTVFRVVPTLVSHENDSQKTRVSSLAGMEVEPSTWYSSRVTLPSHDLAHWRLTSQPCLCSNHHSTWVPRIYDWYQRCRQCAQINMSVESVSQTQVQWIISDPKWYSVCYICIMVTSQFRTHFDIEYP